jgi:hypothetical protein
MQVEVTGFREATVDIPPVLEFRVPSPTVTF